MIGHSLGDLPDVSGIENFDADREIAAEIDALTVNLRERIEKLKITTRWSCPPR